MFSAFIRCEYDLRRERVRGVSGLSPTPATAHMRSNTPPVGLLGPGLNLGQPRLLRRVKQPPRSLAHLPKCAPRREREGV